jgi:hypothetical protein
MALVIAMAAVSQLPRFLRADLRGPVVSTTAEPSLADLAKAAVNADAAISKPAIDKLRAAGPAGLDALMAANEPVISAHRVPAGAPRSGPVDPTWVHITAALDAVAAQRNAYASGLYWYTDLSTAEAAAKAAGKPILSLRLLGNLSDEFSCANSRFFRTVLYANNEVSRHLRDHFILHWQSVRPVPIITIDFGDGRIIRRTITGNSIHYVLTADGQVVDGIPGLYGAKAFLRELDAAEQEVTKLGTLQVTERTTALEAWHSAELFDINKSFNDDRTSLGVAAIAGDDSTSPGSGFPGQSTGTSGASGPPAAVVAARRAFSKSAVEPPWLRKGLLWIRVIAPTPSPQLRSRMWRI